MNSKKIIILIFILILLFVSSFLLFSFIKKQYEMNQLKVTLKEEFNIEINSEVYLLSFIKDIENGNIVTEDKLIDTTKLGIQELSINIKDKYDKLHVYNIKVKVIDTLSPVINAENEIVIYTGNKIDLLKNVVVTDNSKETIKAEVVGEYNINKKGNYKLKYVAKDSSNNITEFEFSLKVLEDPNNRSFTTSKGYTAKIIDGVTYIDNILIVNKTYSLPSTYGKKLTTDTKNAFNDMKKDANSIGLNLYISSGYRSYKTQKTVYNNYVKRDGKTKADTYSARAGHSEHQTGLAFDLNTINDLFGYTEEGLWVNDNCYKYGLIIRYPKDKTNITGYKYEPWHLRYVGKELAEKLYNNGNWITLEEYFGIDSKYKN